MIAAVLALLCTQAPVLEVSWDADTARTGKLLIVEVGTPPNVAPIRSITASLDAKAGVAFAVSSDRRHWRVLVPVDIESKLKPLPLLVAAVLNDGRTSTWKKPIAVREGGYDKRTITVGKQFTHPSKQQQKRAQQEAVLLSSAMKTQSPDRLWCGNFAKPTPGEPTSPFGTLRTYNKVRRSRHLGWDLDGDVGAPIVAAGRGRVLLASERFYTGGTVLIDHGQGLMTMYFHMSRIDVAAGHLVERGESLGAVGASGQVTGPHLHLSVRLAGLYVDPRQLLELDLSNDVDCAPPSASTSGSTAPPAPTRPSR